MPRGIQQRTPENVARATELRRQGMKLREVADELGVSPKTVHSWVTDPDGACLKARKDSYRGECEVCGGPTWGGDGPGRASKVCRDHVDRGAAALKAAAKWEPRRQEIIERWCAGEDSARIAEDFSLPSTKRVSVLIAGWRHRGIDIPHRYNVRGKHAA